MPESLDKALVRPGRFDKKISLPFPDQSGRIKLFEYYLNKINGTDKSLNIEELSRTMIQKTGADIKNLINQAAIISIMNKKNVIDKKGNFINFRFYRGL